MNRVPEDRRPAARRSRPLETATRIVSAGRDPLAQHGFVNTPIYRGSTVLYPNAQDFLAAQGALHLRHQGHADDRVARGRLERACRRGRHGAASPRGWRRSRSRCWRACKSGDHLLVPDSVYRPTRNLCDTMLQALRRRDDLLRSAGRRRHRAACSSRTPARCSPRRRARCRSRCRTFRRSRRSRMRATRSC